MPERKCPGASAVGGEKGKSQRERIGEKINFKNRRKRTVMEKKKIYWEGKEGVEKKSMGKTVKCQWSDFSDEITAFDALVKVRWRRKSSCARTENQGQRCKKQQ